MKPSDAALRAEYEAGATIKQLCERHSLTNHAARKALSRAGTVLRPPLADRNAPLDVDWGEVADEYERGATLKALAKKYRTRHNIVAKHIKRQGAEMRPKWLPHGFMLVPRTLPPRPETRRPHAAPALALEMSDRQALITTVTVEQGVELDPLAAVTVSALSIVAEAFGSELRIAPQHRQGIADLRDRMNRGDRSARFFGNEALEAVDRALAARSPSAHKRLRALCERVAR